MKPVSRKQSTADDWPQAGQFRRSIRLEFSLYLSLVVLALMTVTGYVMTSMYVKKTTEQVVEEALIRMRSYSGTAGKIMLASEKPDALLLNNLLRRLSDDYPDAFWVGIADREGVFLAHTDIKQVIASERLRTPSGEVAVGPLAPGETLCMEGDSISISVPIAVNDIRVGTFAMTSSTREISKARRQSVRTVLTITVLLMLVGVPATLIVLHRKLRPVQTITDHLKEMSLDDISLDIPVRTRNEFGYLARTLGVMGKKLNQAQRDRIERERINRELEIAREIQAGMLPGHYPVGSTFEMSGCYRSALEVGGDYYDFIDFGDDYLGIIVADVSGKSLPGMLVMLLTRDIVKNVVRDRSGPADMLSRVNAALKGSIKKGMFVTMFYGLLHKKTGHLTFASAGHNPLIIVHGRSGKAELIKTRGYPLGMVSAKQFRARIEEARVELKAEDWLVLYTDGVNEARSGNEEFGMDRFVAILESGKNLAPPELVNRVAEGIDGFARGEQQFDDITLLTLKWSAPSVNNEGNTAGTLDHQHQGAVNA